MPGRRCGTGLSSCGPSRGAKGCRRSESWLPTLSPGRADGRRRRLCRPEPRLRSCGDRPGWGAGRGDISASGRPHSPGQACGLSPPSVEKSLILRDCSANVGRRELGGGGRGCEGAPGRPWLICCAWGWTAGRRARRAGGCAGQQEVGLVSLELRSRGVGEEGLVAGVGLAGVGQEC